MKKKVSMILLLLLLIIPSVISLFRPGFFISDDGEWMVIRLTDFHRSLVSGQIPVRWAARLNFGYGYPVFNFLYPLSLYWAEVFHLIGFSFIWSIKLVFILSFFLSGIFMYLLVQKWWGKLAGLVAALAYVYAPYRFIDVYVRGSLGEAVGFVFIPLIFLSLWNISWKKNRLSLIVGSLALAALITAHNIMAFLFLPLIFAYFGLFVWQKKEKKQFLISGSLMMILGLGLSCFFWLPALYDKQFTILDQTPITDYSLHYPTLRQLLIPAWGYGPSIPGPADQTSYQLGLVHLAVVVICLLLLLLRKFKKEKLLVVFLILVFGTAVFLMLTASYPIWKIIPWFWRIQFPWRLLSITTFCSAILAGGLLSRFKGRLKTFLAVLLILGFLFNARYSRPVSWVDRPEGFYTTNEASTTVKDEYLPIWVKIKPTERASKLIEVIKGEGEVDNLSFNSKKVGFDFKTDKGAEVRLNINYFPGWEAELDGQNKSLSYDNPEGVMRFEIDPGEHQVLIEFKETPVRQLADGVSLLSVLAMIGLLIKRKPNV